MSLKQGMTTYRSHLGYDVAVSFRRFKKEIKKKFPINIQNVNKLRKRKSEFYTAGSVSESYIRGFTKTRRESKENIFRFNHEPTYWFKENGSHWITGNMPGDYRMNASYDSPNTIL